MTWQPSQWDVDNGFLDYISPLRHIVERVAVLCDCTATGQTHDIGCFQHWALSREARAAISQAKGE